MGTRVEDIGNGLFEMFDVISIRCFRILPSLSRGLNIAGHRGTDLARLFKKVLEESFKGDSGMIVGSDPSGRKHLPIQSCVQK